MGVVTAYHVRCAHASTVAPAVVGEVPTGRYDPVVPPQLPEADEEPLLAAEGVVPLAVDGAPPHPPGRDALCVHQSQINLFSKNKTDSRENVHFKINKS